MSLDIILIVLCCLLTLLAASLAFKLYHFSVLLIDLEDDIERSLDMLDTKYTSISEILERPVFFDSVEIRQVLSDVSECRRTILIVANTLTRNARMDSEKTEEKNS